MKFFTRIAVLFHVTLILFMCSFMGLFALNWIVLSDIQDLFFVAYFDENLRIIISVLAGIMLFVNFVFYKVFSVNQHRDKIIAFDNPSGRVSISLAALEDMVKRKINKVDEIKDGKANITASKKGLHVKVRLVLCSEVNIPEIASKVQDMITRKVQDLIGLDDPINVAVYVGKILPEKIKEKSEEVSEIEKKSEINVPFQGYRA